MERAEQVVQQVDGPGDPRTDPAPVEHERPLSLAGVSEDRAQLLLVDDRGATFTLPVTPALRAALRGDASRLGQLEIPMESALRPRDIQARIRSGETAESVAEAARTSVDKIMAFVGPVLAERQHVADRAQRSNLRRRSGETGTTGRSLGDAVEAHLRSLNVDPDGVEWDAWKREDGRWTLTAGYALPARTGTAHFSYDVPGNFVVLDDEDARWLVGEAVASPAPARDDLRSVRERRLTTIPQDELPLGDDAIELVSDDHEPTEPLFDAPGATPVEAFLDDSPASDDPALREEVREAVAAEPDPEPDPEPETAPAEATQTAPVEEEPPARRTVQKKKGRASVPSWDEIMFGPGTD